MPVCKDDVSSEKLKACDSSEMDSVISTEVYTLSSAVLKVHILKSIPDIYASNN